jgi:DNA-binding CsgD family transcriptional regulator/tetratricopeptide (TPR) repeat protein
LQQLPASLRLTSALPFVGRSAELDKLRTLLPRATGESLRTVLLGGEPGSGKSRLVREFATEAVEQGALVLYGACDAVVQAPYGPFVEALERLPYAVDPEELTAELRTGATELARLVPALPLPPAQVPPAVLTDPDTERHRLHTAAADLLAALGRRRPVLLVIEDAHWADSSSLLMLRHLARTAADGRALMLVTFRDVDAEMPESLSATLADLRRSEQAVRIRLTALSRSDVADFVARAAEGKGSGELPELAAAISELTGGNPFLVCELWRALIETGAIEAVDGAVTLTRPLAELGTPESVREVVSERLARLSPETTVLLELASAVGTEFELEVVRRGSGLAEADLVAALDEAVRSGIVEELRGPGLAYRFTHELVRRAVYDRLTGVRRAELHLRVGEAREASEERSPRALADLAHHFTAAAPLADPDRAVAYNRLAATAATEAFAFDDAARYLSTSLELGVEDERERAELLLELGEATHRAGRSLEAIRAFESAAEIARRAGDVRLLARAAIGYEDAHWRPGVVGDATGLLEEAAIALGEERSELRVGLLSGLARALDMQGDRERGATVRRSAILLARQLGDRAGLANVLMRSYWSRGATSLPDILGMLTEAQALGEEIGSIEIQTEAGAWRCPTLVAMGELPAARRQVDSLLESARASAQPFMVHVAEHYRSAIALSEGRLADAEDAARRSHEAGRLLIGRDASGTYGIQVFSIRREQGRLAELAPVVRVLAGSGRERGPWRPGMVAVLAELGMEDEARRELARIGGEGIEQFRESLWLAALAYIADASTALGDAEAAAMVYPELEPLAGTVVMIGHLVEFYGAADRYLGMLAATIGEWPRAEQHFERALELNRRMGADTWLAHTQYEYARGLRAAGRDEERVGALAGEARQLAARIGLNALGARIDALRGPAPAPALPDGHSAPEAEILRLVAPGLSNREIGKALYISEHTAANHIRSILRKTGCANRTEATSYAHRQSLVGS